MGQTAEPSWQAALALALGARQDAASVPLLAGLLRQNNDPVLEAAIYALGQVADTASAKALAAALPTVPQKHRLATAESYVKCAERMLADGNANAAAAIYRELDQPTQARPVRLAARQGRLKCAGDQAASTMLEWLAGDDADARAIATGFISDLDSATSRKLAAEMGKLPVTTQAMVLAALAERGEKAVRPEALAAARSADETLRVAGLSALGRLGDATTVPLLVDTMWTGGNAVSAAKTSLLRLDGANVNSTIIAALQRDNDPGHRAELISVLEARNASDATPVLLQELRNDNASVRRAALRALGKVAEPKDVPAMLQALLKAAPGGERDEGERAIAAVCARITDPNSQAGPVLTAYDKAAAAEKAVLLPLVGRFGGAKALELVKAALAGNDSALQKAAETALLNWPDADDAVEKELLSLAQRSQRPNERSAALRAYVRVLAMPSGLPEKARLSKFQQAMGLSSRDEERNFVLERVGEIKHVETLRFLVPYLDNAPLANRAGATICDLARERGVRDRNRAEFDQALNKIVVVCKDQSVVERAKRRLQEK